MGGGLGRAAQPLLASLGLTGKDKYTPPSPEGDENDAARVYGGTARSEVKPVFGHAGSHGVKHVTLLFRACKATSTTSEAVPVSELAGTSEGKYVKREDREGMKGMLIPVNRIFPHKYLELDKCGTVRVTDEGSKYLLRNELVGEPGYLRFMVRRQEAIQLPYGHGVPRPEERHAKVNVRYNNPADSGPP